MQRGFIFFKQFIALTIIFSLSNGIFAQTKKGSTSQTTAKVKITESAQKCSGAWTGSVTYSRYQKMTDIKTTPRVSGRGEDKRDFEMIYDYKASVAVLEAPEKNGSSIGKAKITHDFSSTEKTTAVEKNSCDRGKTWQDMRGEFLSKAITVGEESADANVNVGVNSDGTYTVSVGVPQIKGKTSGSQSSTFSGQCTPKEGKTLNMPPADATIDGNSLTSDGKDRIEPSDPNKISGEYSKTWQNVTEKITWNLEKCGAPLRITDLRFEDMKFPKWNDWQEINEQNGTVDGNLVRIKAKILNLSGETKNAEVYLKETYKGDKWDGAKPDVPLKDQTFSFRIDPNEEKEVEMLWNSQGYAWFDDGRPRLVQRIKAELWENYKKIDDLTKNLKVVPKPIVFVGGIWTNPQDFEYYQNLLTTTHSYGWKTYRMIDVSNQGTIAGDGVKVSSKTNKTVYDNADNLEKYVDMVRSNGNAWHVDMLAHSTGGLVARLYIHKQMPILDDGYPVVKHLMMMGTPNLGVPCADSMANNDAFKNNMQTAKEIMPDEMAIFNKFVNQKKGAKFSALVGDTIPILCASPQWNDGFVSVESAKFGADDFAITKSMHPNMINTKTFNDFVKPHVVTGPRGTYPLPIVSEK
ncbi:MAG: putative lipase [Pyrinomonadaceae bacterium]|nr:putative lipase [Pyrinomonadaceae bacterium]